MALLSDLLSPITSTIGNLVDATGNSNTAARQAANLLTANTNANNQTQQGITTAGGRIQGGLNTTINNLNPYTTTGGNAATALNNFNTNTPTLYNNGATYQDPNTQPQTFTPSTFNYKSSPGYQAALDAATKAGANANSASGLTGSSIALKNAQTTAGNLADSDFQNQYQNYLQQNNLNNTATQENMGQYNTNRNFGAGQYQTNLQDYMNQMNNKYNQLYSTTGLGLNATGQQNTATTNAATDMAGLDLRSGASNANAAENVGNIIAGREGAQNNANSLFNTSLVNGINAEGTAGENALTSGGTNPLSALMGLFSGGGNSSAYSTVAPGSGDYTGPENPATTNYGPYASGYVAP